MGSWGRTAPARRRSSSTSWGSSRRRAGRCASSGLDPIVRRDILGAVMRTIAGEGRTVLFSSHLLDEVEEVADHVTMIQGGKIVLSAPLAEIKAAHSVDGRQKTLDEIFVERVGAPMAEQEG